MNGEIGKKNKMKVLAASIEYFDKHGYAPSVRELCDATGFASTSTIQKHFDDLLIEGYLETDIPRGNGTPRAFRIGARAYDEGYASR